MSSKLVCAIFIWYYLWVLLLVSSLTLANESDIGCLRTLKSQLKDPNGELFDWAFGNNTYICKFNGVDCWKDTEDMVISINLGSFGLEGEFPSGVKECTSMQNLNLYGNKLSGTLPPDIFSILRYLVSLDLSNNSFSGEIPATWANNSFLNTLLLDHNQLTGHIPPALASMPRLTQFSVSYNNLKGPIPKFTNAIYGFRFDHNPGLCGFPLDPCFSTYAYISGAGAAAVIFPVGAAIGWFCIDVGQRRKQRPRRP